MKAEAEGSKLGGLKRIADHPVYLTDNMQRVLELVKKGVELVEKKQG